MLRGGRLFCASCGQVETFDLVRDPTTTTKTAECTVCGKEYTSNASAENLYMEGVDYDFQRTVVAAQMGMQPQSDDDLLLFCSGCFQNTQHKENYIAIVRGEKTEYFGCLSCQKVRMGRTRRNKDGSYTSLDTPNTPSLASTYHQSDGNDGYGGWGYCNHWRDPVKVGRWTVYVSASSDRPTITQRAAVPRGKEPIMPDYGLYFATDRTGYGIGWGAKVQTTPDFPAQELEFVTVYPRLFYDWVDMGAPRSPIVIKLVEWAVKKIKEGKKLDLGCFGGHGRTGTFLALLYITIEGLTATEAMKAVWARHCEQAIETYVQKKFIYEFNGEKPPPPPVSTYGSGTGTSGVKGVKRNSKYKYLSRKEKKQLKSSRKKNRRMLRDCVTEAVAAGIKSRKVLEEGGRLWGCERCGNIKRSNGTFGMSKDAKWHTYCSKCTQTSLHTRPGVLYELLVESDKSLLRG